MKHYIIENVPAKLLRMNRMSIGLVVLCYFLTAISTSIAQNTEADSPLLVFPGIDPVNGFATGYSDRVSWENDSKILREHLSETLQVSRFRRSDHPYQSFSGGFQCQGYDVGGIHLQVMPGCYITGNSYGPLGRTKYSPSIFILHDHVENGRMSKNIQALCAVLARAGAHVYVFDLVGFGDLAHIDHKDPRALRLQLFYNIKILDYLSSLPWVDQDRLTCIGIGSGATHAVLLGAIDSRVDIFVQVRKTLSEQPAICPCKEHYKPLLRPGQANLVDLSAMIAPRRQLIISQESATANKKIPDDLRHVQSVYTLLKSEDNLSIGRLQNAEEVLRSTERTAIVRYLTKSLGLKPKLAGGDTIDESFVETFPVGEIDCPIREDYPSNAIMNLDRIIKVLDEPLE